MTTLHDPNAAANPDSGIFGLPYSFEESKLVYLPVPWEATTSYGGGTVFGPQAIFEASFQLDLFDLDVLKPYEAGLHSLPISDSWVEKNKNAKELAQAIKDAQGVVNSDVSLQKRLSAVNQASRELNQWVEAQVSQLFQLKKIPAIIGGDHSVPFGAFQAAAKHEGNFGILHFDAHSDTRIAYMGFEHSHASIMHNAATQIPQITKFVQVGIRDFCEQEFNFTRSQGARFEVYYDQHIQVQKQKGTSFQTIAESIIKNLPEKVWVSFDIDGLDPKFCPHTGTPVPGGLDYSEAILILRLLAKSGRKIIGFDVVEVAPPLEDATSPKEPVQAIDEWDANVGMRLIYKLSAFALASQKFAKWNVTQEA